MTGYSLRTCQSSSPPSDRATHTKKKTLIRKLPLLYIVTLQGKAPTYTATKGAIASFSKGLAIDEAANNVRVNIVSPGNIWTPLWKSWSDGEADPTAAREAGDRVQVLACPSYSAYKQRMSLFVVL